MKLQFVTSNPGKALEAALHLKRYGIQVKPVSVIPVEIQADSLEAVAQAKAESLRSLVNPPYFVEDAGLFVEALRGFPGVYSAYVFQTLGCQGILKLMKTQNRRAAFFQAVVALVEESGSIRLFTGRAHGTLARNAQGEQGFGYDPIFLPRGRRETFAELSPTQKSQQSHRGQALDRMGRFLESQQTKTSRARRKNPPRSRTVAARKG